MIFLTIILVALCATLYRMGGAAKTGQWYDFMLNTKARDFGCSVVGIAFLYILGIHNILALAATFLFQFGGFSTYAHYHHDGKKIQNFWLHGFIIGAAAFPVVILTGHWIFFAIRAIVMAVWSGTWSKIFKNAVIEEVGRILLFIPTLPMIV